MNKIKLMIAKEGLFVLGLAAALYIFLFFFLQKMPVAMAKYRLEFADGSTYIIAVTPEIRNDYDYKKLLKETYDPPPGLIDKRIKEFMRAGNIKSSLKSSSFINRNQVYLSKLYSRILGVPFILKLAFIYAVLLIVRFIIWAVRILNSKRRQ